MNIDNLSAGIQKWLLDLAISPTDARSVIVAARHDQLSRDVLNPLRDALGEAVVLSTAGPSKVFGRRVHIVTREEQMLGMAPRSILVHVFPGWAVERRTEYLRATTGCQIYYA